MDVAVIGAGFTGLSAAHELAKKGVNVCVFEQSKAPGGLAGGYKEDGWKWSLDFFYHHIFTSDASLKKLANEVGQKITFTRPITSTYYKGEVYQLDSPLSLMRFPHLSTASKIRTGVFLAYLKSIPYSPDLEQIPAELFIKKTMGMQSWKVMWEPLFVKKFGKYSNEVNAAWFWARIKKRSISLGYPESGFLSFAEKIGESIHKNSGEVRYKEGIKYIKAMKDKVVVRTTKKMRKYDRVICTLTTPAFLKITKALPKEYIKSLSDMKGLGFVNLVITLDRQFFSNGDYWLGINDIDSPLLAVVEHTNFIGKEKYNNDNLLYVADYVEPDHTYFKMSRQKLLDRFLPYLKNINPDFNKSWIRKYRAFKHNFAQPVMDVNYSKKIPSMITPLKGVFLANMQQVYPWDRGVNYAIELGKRSAEMVIKS